MAVAVRSTTTKNADSATTIVVDKPTGTTQGDLLVCLIFQDSDGTAASLTAPAGWSQAGATITGSGTGPYGKIFYHAAGAAEPTSYTFNISSNASTSALCYALTGANTTTPIRVDPVVASSLTAPSIAAGSGQQAGDLLLCGFTGQGSTNSFTNSSALTSFISQATSWESAAAGVAALTGTGATGTQTVTSSVGSPRAVSLVIALGFVAKSGTPAPAVAKLSATRGGAKQAAGSASAKTLLTAARTGAKATAGAPVGTLHLAAGCVGAPNFDGGGAAATPLRLSATATGKKINAVAAVLRLSAAVPSWSITGRAAVTATLHLDASAAAAPTHRSSTPTAAVLHLTRTQTGRKQSTATRTALLHLTGEPGSGTKQVRVARSGLLLLAAALSGTTRASTVSTGARLLLSTGLHSRSHTTIVGEVDAAPLRLAADANTKRIFTEAAVALRAKASQAVSYELVCVGRIPATQGQPTFLQVDPIDWSGLSYVDELSKPQQLNVGCQIAGLTEPILQRLRDLATLATELWLYRDGVLVFAGPLLGWQVQSESLTLTAQGLLAYLGMMVVQTDLVYKQADQFSIVTGLIDQWQALDYGNFGIDTTGISPSGVKRDATYLKTELHNVGQRVYELSQRANGFDVAIDPKSRKLELSYPIQGVDRSSGEDSIVFDARNVTSPNILCSAGVGDVASEAFVTGTSATGGAAVYATAANTELRSKYGRTAVTASYQDVSEQSTANDYATALEAARGQALLIPGPDVRVTPDADLRSYTVGDTVSYTLHEKLSVSGSFRIRKRQVTVSKTGQEAVTVQFV